MPTAASLSPVDIDTRLAELEPQLAKHNRLTGQYLDLAAKRERYTESSRAAYRATAAEHQAQAVALAHEVEPLRREYRDRRWERAFLVTNAGGHIHRTTSCGTCFPSTQFSWLTQLSGSTEAEIIAAAAHRACTVCYPDAPVVTREERERITRAEADERRAVKAAAKLARELAKVPRAHALALKMNELYEENDGGRARYDYDRKGYDTAFSAYNNMREDRERFLSTGIARRGNR